MKVLFLSEVENLQVLDIKDVLDKFLKTGVNPKYLKHIVESLDTQGFDIGKVDGIAHVVIKLELPHCTISIQFQSEDKLAYKGAKDFSHI